MKWKLEIVMLWSIFAEFAYGSSFQSLTAATFNIWNIMFNWDVRRIRIAQMLKEVDVDIVGLQEVRGGNDRRRDQVQDIQDMTRYLYPHSVFLPAQQVTFPKGVQQLRWELEGVGLLSRFPIVNHTGIPLKHHGGPDTNRRLALHALVDVGNKHLVSVIVAHFSYDRNQQCANAADIINYITERRLKDVVLLGDFNTYHDFEWPVQQFTGTTVFNKCLQPVIVAPNRKFRDVWSRRSNDAGYTFSNMPQPGLESRPDRIFVSQNFVVERTKLLGDGSIYKNRFYFHVILSRIGKVWETMQGRTQGRSCLIDCGPHASCRCGLCVSGGDQNTCEVPDCKECGGSGRILVLMSLGLMVVLTLLIIFGLLRLFNAMNQSGQSEIGTCLGAHCCLCNPSLYCNDRTSHKHNKTLLGSFTKSFLCRRLPPMTFLICTVIVFFCAAQLVLSVCSEVLQDVFNAIPEEFYPSDHLMLVASLKLRSEI